MEMQSRRTFIRNIALAIPAYSFAGTLLSSCGTNEKHIKKSGLKIGIIGAGISGLHAAYMLQNEYGYEVEILEASDAIGGRIQSVDNLFDMGMVELGAAEIIGNSNIWHQTVKQHAGVRSTTDNSSYYFQGLQYSQEDMSNDSEFKSMEAKLTQLSSGVSDVSVETYMNQVQVPERVRFIFKDKAEQMLGTSIDRASALYNSHEGLGKLDVSKYTSTDSFNRVIMKQYATVMPAILNNTQVVSIDYQSDQVVVTDHLQVQRTYNHVIVTVPLSVLKLKPEQAYGISFTPGLPEQKLQAMQMLGMDAGVRILIQTNQSFWHDGAEHIFMEGLVGQFELIKSDKQKNLFLLSATVHGEKAELLNNMDSNDIIRRIKSDIKEQISEEAAASITQHKVIYWGKSPFIQGSFSYHKVGGSNASRAELAKPVKKKVFFAGEACNTKNNSGTVHGAIETAVEAVKHIHRLQS